MANVKIHVTDGGPALFGGAQRATTIDVTRPTKVQAVAEAVAMLLSTCRPDIDEVVRQARLIGTALQSAGLMSRPEPIPEPDEEAVPAAG